MKNRKMLLPALLSIALVFSLILPASAAGASATVPLPDDRSVIHSMMDGSSLASAMILNTPAGNVTPMVATGHFDVVGLKSDGTVVAAGYNDYGQCDVCLWTDIIRVAAGYDHTVGVKSDGRVVAVGGNNFGQRNVATWVGITQVAAGVYHTVGLKSDGTAVAVGINMWGQCDVSNWTNITQVAAGYDYTVGVKSDGTVVAVGRNEDGGECEVGSWTNITQVAACSYHTVGLKSDGTVVVAGTDFAELATWNLILAVPPSQCPPISGGGGCFIATAVYGTPMAEEVQILREFRDKYLLTNPVGKGLVGFYYKVSPPIAEFITEHPSLKPIVRAGLVPAVAMSAIAVNTTPAEKAAIMGLLVLVSVVLAIWATKRRDKRPKHT